MRPLARLLAGLALGLLATRAGAQQPLRSPALVPLELRSAGEREPLGLDRDALDLAWQLAATDPARRDLRQLGHRVLVASSLELLARDEGDVLDTGEVEGSQQFVRLPGLAQRPPFTHLWWKVRVRDQDGTDSPWSAPAHFALGPRQDGWTGQWIGHDAPLGAQRREPDLAGAHWLGAATDERECVLRTSFALATLDGLRAGVLLAVAEEHELLVNGKSVARGAQPADAPRSAQLVRLGPELVVGTNTLALRLRRADAAPAAIAKLVLEERTGTRTLPSDTSWQVAATAAGPWSAARPLGAEEVEALGPVLLPSVFLPPPRLLRSEFETPVKPARATLHASALGLYSLELNGMRVGQDWFAPGWTDYTQRVPYRSYDVTHLVASGANALGAVLADGWYAGFLGKAGRRDNYGARTRLLVQLELEYPDGTRQSVTSGPDWRAATGPWLEADLFMGERFDARRVPFGWSAPGFATDGWVPVDVGHEGEFALSFHDGQPIELLTELRPVALTRDPAGRWIFDFGQNFAGVARLALEAPAGTSVRLRFGERLDAQGALYRRNLGWARAADVYVCRGGGREVWTPRFTYHGFRYVEVTGLPGTPTPDMLTGLVLTSAIDDTGTFTCSDETIHGLVELARWSLRSNAMDVPTDCPQRGERLGWLGDGQLFAPSALWLADVTRLYAKWCRDIADARRPDGSLPAIAPAAELVGSGGPGWDEAALLVPALLYQRSGHAQALEGLLQAERSFRRDSRAASGYGDWNAREPGTPLALLALGYRAKVEHALAERQRTAKQNEPPFDLAPELRAEFEREWLTPEGGPRVTTQTALALALTTGLVPPGARARFGEALVASLAARGPATGFLGTAELFPALSALGRTDVALSLLSSRAYPAFGSLLERGATTLWERMDSWTPEHGLANGGMTSFNHTPFGSYVAWLFEHVAGLRAAEPGFAALAFEPEPTRALAFAEARHLSVRGELGLRWEWDGPALRIDVLVPPNTPATLRIPGATAERVTEGGKPLSAVPGLRATLDATDLLLAFGSGTYSFRIAP